MITCISIRFNYELKNTIFSIITSCNFIFHSYNTISANYLFCICHITKCCN